MEFVRNPPTPPLASFSCRGQARGTEVSPPLLRVRGGRGSYALLEGKPQFSSL